MPAHIRWLTRALAWLLLGALLAAWPQARAAPVHTLREAQAELQPQGLPAWQGELKLSHRWDEAYPGRSGQARYRLRLPPTQGSEPHALLFSRVGNQAELRVNGSVVARLGQPGDELFDAAKTSWMVTVPAALLAATEDNTLEVTVGCQPGRWGGLSLVQFGTLADVEPLYRRQRLWRVSLPVVMASGFVLMGLTALGLWWRQRVPLYGWFSIAALLGLVRHLDRVWPDLPLPWPWLGALVAMAYAAHLALMTRVALEIVAASTRRLERFLAATLLATSALALAAFLLDRPLLWTAALVLLVPYGATAAVIMARAAWARRGRTLGRALLGGLVLLVLASTSDLLLVRLGLSPGSFFSVLPLAVFFIAILVAALVVARYNATVDAYRALNAELAERVQQREGELRQAFDALREGQREQAATEERQRLMREIHDGVGAHLVLLLNMAEKGQAEPEAIQQQAKMALDEMRMAVDAMQPVHGDLGTVLATMRYRLLPRLQAAGLTMRWDVDRLPPLPGLTPPAVLQVHRILMEALTNVLRHARAHTVDVQAHVVDRAIVVTLQDDGIGLPAAPPAGNGHGLANMLSRAQAIGAELSISRVAPRGTRVELRWPLPIMPA